MAMLHPSSVSFDGLSPQLEDELLRFPASSFGKFLVQAREEAGVTQKEFIEAVNEIVTQKNPSLPKDRKIPAFTFHVYGNLERDDRYPLFEEFEPLYQTLSLLLPDSFSSQERERYYTVAKI